MTDIEAWDAFRQLAPRQQVEDMLLAAYRVVSRVADDYCYRADHDRCVYTEWRGDVLQASCLVAQILEELGLDPAQLVAYEGANAGMVGNQLGLHPETCIVLRGMQAAQDSGSTWQLALAVGRGLDCDALYRR